MAFPFSKEPIAGIRPIAEMLAGGDTGHPRAVQARAKLFDSELTDWPHLIFQRIYPVHPGRFCAAIARFRAGAPTGTVGRPSTF